MLRITKQADYAIVLLSHFITDDVAGDYTARGLSVATGIPLPMVGKILKALAERHVDFELPSEPNFSDAELKPYVLDEERFRPQEQAPSPVGSAALVRH